MQIRSLALLISIMMFITSYLPAQNQSFQIESVVNDENGNHLSGVKVYSGRSFATTDASGEFTLEVTPGSQIILESPGFVSQTFLVDEITDQTTIVMEHDPLVYGNSDQVQVAFREKKKGDVIGFVSDVNTTEVDDHDNIIWANDILAGRTLGLLGNNSIRGIGIGINTADVTGSGLSSGNALFIVDGLPRDIQSLRASEIESISVLKDVNSSILYGSAAINGVVLITTKRGEAYKSQTNFSARYGISQPRALPQFLNSADYMTYNNMARINDGLSPQYSDETIENYRNGNPYRYPDINYYSDEYLKPSTSYVDVNGQLSGGNSDAKYYANFGLNSNGNLLNYGTGKTARHDIFNVRGNVDLKVNDWIRTAVDGTAIFGSNNGQRGNFWSDAATTRPYEYTPLIPIDLVMADNSLVAGRKNDVDGQYLIGGNSNHIRTPEGDGYAGGEFQRISRKFSFNNRIDFNLDRITQGLSFHTNISFDFFTRYNQTIANEYSVYEPIWSDSIPNLITDLKQHGKDARPGVQSVGNSFFQRRVGFYGMASYDRTFNTDHHFTGTLLGFGSTFKQQGDFQGVKQAHLGFQVGYAFRQTYLFDFSGAYVNSVKLPSGNRGGFAPSFGVAWILSNEDFMASNERIDFLKLRLSTGVLKSDIPIGGFFYYDNRYGGSGSYNWLEGSRSRGGVRSNWSSNFNLGFAERQEVNAGVEGLFFDQTISVTANVFHEIYSGLVTRPNTVYPGFYSDFIPYENFDKDKYQGMELGVGVNKSFGHWNFHVGANLLYVTSERTKVDEVYDNDYQYRQGYPRDATFGLEAIGLFQDQSDIENSPIQAFGTVQPGDIKYRDQNGDGIVDNNDEVYLRRWQAPLSAGIRLSVSYKDLTLFVLGEGRSGAENFLEGNYYWVDGNDKYSEIVLGSWTPETSSSATYPRLSSQSNSNNFRRSSYWLYSNDFLQIRKIQMTYHLPETILQTLRMKDVSVFLSADNVIQFAKNKEVRDLNVGGQPYYRTFSLGLQTNF